jgi:magnesium-transporting ATPase (P-type)
MNGQSWPPPPSADPPKQEDDTERQRKIDLIGRTMVVLALVVVVIHWLTAGKITL